jgi:hypothetical protein
MGVNYFDSTKSEAHEGDAAKGLESSTAGSVAPGIEVHLCFG